MDVRETVASTAGAAFASDRKGRIVAWNAGAERMLGHAAPDVCGKRCFEVLDGIDVFGNRFCDEQCPIRGMVRRHEAVHHCELSLRTKSSDRVKASLSVFVLSGPGADYSIVHVLEPMPARREGPNPGKGAAGSSNPVAGAPGRQSSPDVPLTGRETEVLRMLAAGATTSEIARGLSISGATVRNHVHQILKKTNAHSRLEAVCTAIRRRLL